MLLYLEATKPNAIKVTQVISSYSITNQHESSLFFISESSWFVYYVNELGDTWALNIRAVLGRPSFQNRAKRQIFVSSPHEHLKFELPNQMEFFILSIFSLKFLTFEYILWQPDKAHIFLVSTHPFATFYWYRYL